MADAPHVGLLPLYIALYDEVRPEARPEMQAFADRVADALQGAGLRVERAPIACVRHEVEAAVRELMQRDVELVATLHLAYSPSMEAVDALCRAQVPLVLLDTTPAERFGADATAADMFRNHGIHGVQDLACMLRRHQRPYLLAVGHVDDPAFVAEVTTTARAAQAAWAMRHMRVLVLGDPFTGMGDFAVPEELLRRRLGIESHRASVEALAQAAAQVPEEEIAAECAADAERFDLSELPPEVLVRTNRVGLGVRRMLDEAGAGAFSFNFSSFTGESGVGTVPFLEASKAMARGIGYAGEADALTAALVGALGAAGCRATFTEMFCPHWTEGTVFMSHMGECNLALACGDTKLVEKPYAFSTVGNPAVAIPKLEPGAATLVNLAPGPQESFDLIAARVEVLDRGPVAGFPDVPHFWIRPVERELRGFLRRYSELGGTHHLALCMGDEVELVGRMAQMLGIGFALV
ncbi:MAG: hypothetical protein AB7Y46_03680 [Armatimonadota bacterium]